jgi:hypothetical protein
MKLFTLILLLTAVSAAPALARQVPTQAEAKKCELGGNKIGKAAPTAPTKGQAAVTTKATG